jgi:hypothetical protein
MKTLERGLAEAEEILNPQSSILNPPKASHAG